MHRISKVLFPIFVILSLLGATAGERAQAQSTEADWTPPVNLSHSGAAEQPRIVAALDGRLRAFWWDRFDGLMTSISSGSLEVSLSWSTPITATITDRSVIAMPYLIADASGWVHAFWLGGESGGSLFHSQSPIAATLWTTPTELAESALAFDVSAAPVGGLSVAYVRTRHTDEAPAGVYVQHSVGRGAAFGAPAAVYPTIYFRLLTVDDAWVQVSDAGNGLIQLAWEDARLGQALYAASRDGGASWLPPQALGDPDDRPAVPQVASLPAGGLLRTWQASIRSGCVLYQQSFTGHPRVVDAKQFPANWSQAQRIFDTLTTCPSGEQFWPVGGTLFQWWGEGSSSLSLAALNADNSEWSLPQSIRFSFTDPETNRQASLDDLHVAIFGNALVVVGASPETNEVWVTSSQVKALDLASAPPSPWHGPQTFSLADQSLADLAVTVDGADKVYLAWSQPAGNSAATETILYARYDPASTGAYAGSRATEIVQAGTGELARQPSLLASSEWLHLAWSGGMNGGILYSRAALDQAGSSGSWAPPQEISDGLPGGWPQLAVDLAGRLYLLYTVPINEGRGVYLARSDDQGRTWLKPQPIFDAAQAGWEMVAQPALAVSPEGMVFTAWVQATMSGRVQGIWVARSDDQGETWSQPFTLAGDGFQRPRLAVSGGMLHAIFARTSGGLYQRATSSYGKMDAGWGTASPVPGFNSAVVFALSADAQTLHLAAVATDGLLYSTFTGERWSSVETYLPLEADVCLPAETACALAADAPLGGETLAVAWLGRPSADGDSLFVAVRAIPPADLAAVPTPIPTITPTPTLIPTVVPSVLPTATPDLRLAPPANKLPLPPMMLGGGIAAVIVVGFLGMWLVWRRERP